LCQLNYDGNKTAGSWQKTVGKMHAAIIQLEKGSWQEVSAKALNGKSFYYCQLPFANCQL
jgi:hypothetical protein